MRRKERGRKGREKNNLKTREAMNLRRHGKFEGRFLGGERRRKRRNQNDVNSLSIKKHI